jgi:hypothetical protein
MPKQRNSLLIRRRNFDLKQVNFDETPIRKKRSRPTKKNGGVNLKRTKHLGSAKKNFRRISTNLE